METNCSLRRAVLFNRALPAHNPHAPRYRVFVHISAVEKAGLSTLNEGAKVSYEEVTNNGKTSAENLRVG